MGHNDKIKQNIKAHLQNTATKIMQHSAQCLIHAVGAEVALTSA
jgi:N12 class adenine-specific DNA methylase